MAMTTLGGDTAVSGEVADAEVAAALFRSLGDVSRLAIVRHLTLGEHRVVDLVAHLGLAQSTVSAHLACLRACDLITSRPVGRASMFSLRHHAALAGVLAAAEVLLGATGNAVALCPTAGTAQGAGGQQDAIRPGVRR